MWQMFVRSSADLLCFCMLDTCFTTGWRHCDDSRVTSISHEKNVVTRSAYLLFYRRRQTFLPPIRDCLSPAKSDQSEDDEFQSAPSDNEDDALDTSEPDRLVIDSSPSVEELPDLEESTQGQINLASPHKETDIIDDDDDDLEYTDMDAVD